MVPEKLIGEFVGRLQSAAGANLKSVTLYGSAAAGEYLPDYSNVDLLCVLGETSFAAIAGLASSVEWWAKQKHHPPLLMTQEELQRSADVFSIEFLDMKRNYRVLWGEDVLKTLDVPMKLHRAQVEYELREKTILLRQRLLAVAGDRNAKWELLLRSAPAFGTLARHAVIALGEPPAESKREAVRRLGAKSGLDLTAFLQLFDLREGKAERNKVDVDELFARYLKAVEQLTGAVDAMLD
ncbi:MAG: nucleotidyltransferase domain-containing protein [Terriglobales bacterium]